MPDFRRGMRRIGFALLAVLIVLVALQSDRGLGKHGRPRCNAFNAISSTALGVHDWTAASSVLSLASDAVDLQRLRTFKLILILVVA